MWARSDCSIVVTFDEDFADARMFPTGSHPGVIRLRVWPTTIETTEVLLGGPFEEQGALRGRLFVAGA